MQRFSIAIFSKYAFCEIVQYVMHPTNWTRENIAVSKKEDFWIWLKKRKLTKHDDWKLA